MFRCPKDVCYCRSCSFLYSSLSFLRLFPPLSQWVLLPLPRWCLPSVSYLVLSHSWIHVPVPAVDVGLVVESTGWEPTSFLRRVLLLCWLRTVDYFSHLRVWWIFESGALLCGWLRNSAFSSAVIFSIRLKSSSLTICFRPISLHFCSSSSFSLKLDSRNRSLENHSVLIVSKLWLDLT